MADNDVDEILQKFFVTIAEKDEDAFKLYEDNKRMRALVAQTLRAREELEGRLNTTLLLVNSLQTALHEKEHLIAAQDDESASWRDHIAELRAVLDRPSELDDGVGDIVEDVRSMAAELRSLRHAFQYAQWCCDGWEAYAVDTLMNAEARERSVLIDGADAVLQFVDNGAEIIRVAVREAAHQHKSSSSAKQEWEAQYEQLQGEHQELMEAHARETSDSERAAREHQAEAKSLQRDLAAVRAETGEQMRRWRLQQQRQAVEGGSLRELVSLLAERCRCAETKWTATTCELREVVQLLANAQHDRDAVTEKLESVLLMQEHSRLRLAKVVKQMELMKHAQSDAETLQQRCAGQQEELRVMREKYLACAEKERNMRQQLHSAAETATTKLHAAEDALSSSQRHRFAAEERLRTTQEEMKALQKEVASLRRQAEEHHATEVLLHSTQEQLRETERHSFNFQAALDTLKADQQAQQRAEAARHADELAALSETHADEVQRVIQKGRDEVDAVEAALQCAKEAHAEEKGQLRHELQQWVDEVEVLKHAKSAQEDQLEAERGARQLLEQQQRQETSMVRTMLEHSREESQRGPHLADLQSQVSAMAQRNALLEEACRRSASVIAQLREALHREQIVSRTLRQRDNLSSP